MSDQVFKSGNVIGDDKVRVHRGGNRIDGVSHDNEIFQVDLPVPKRSKIPLSFDRKLSFNMGELIPILSRELYPGDTFHVAQAHNLMLAPLIAPLFHRVDYRTWYFAVPIRLLWDGWKDFITNVDPTNHPWFTCADLSNYISPNWNSLPDYLDLPVHNPNFSANTRHLNPWGFRSYIKIWNEFFRDEFKQSKITEYTSGQHCTAAEIRSWYVKPIGWEKDYFTTCQVNPQFGQDVNIPVGISSDNSFIFSNLTNGSSPVSGDAQFNGTNGIIRDSNGNSLKYFSGLKSTGTINDLRMANHLQKYRDKLQIAGARYNEQILAEYGVVVPDYRIQRPEYIGGFATPVEIGKVMQTTPTASTPLASYAGSGQSSGRMDYIHYFATEHCIIMGLCAVVPRTGYDQGIPREMMHTELTDYYHPDFATLGDQAVFEDEIYLQDSSSASYIERFGYNQRYNELRYSQDCTNGEFRSSLNFWHMNREFAAPPALNGSFVECDPTTRIFAVQNNTNKIYAEIYQQIDAVRPMPISVLPTLDD